MKKSVYYILMAEKRRSTFVFRAKRGYGRCKYPSGAFGNTSRSRQGEIIVALSVLQALNCKGIKGLCFRTREAVVVRRRRIEVVQRFMIALCLLYLQGAFFAPRNSERTR